MNFDWKIFWAVLGALDCMVGSTMELQNYR